MINTRIEDVNYETAAKYLEGNIENNRPLSGRAVEDYARQMKSGQWQFNGDSIKFDKNGVLLDGQHRLHAIIKSKVAVPMLIVEGVEKESFLTIDTGRKRTAAHVLSIMKYKNATTLAGAVKSIVAINRALNAKAIYITKVGARLSNQEVLQFVKANKSLTNIVRLSAGRYGKATRLLSPSYAVALYFLFAQKDADMAADFFYKLSTGLGLQEGSPVYKLREKLLEKSDAKRETLSVRVALTIKAWNAIRTGKSLRSLSISFDEPIEQII